MAFQQEDTIAAIATPIGQAGIGIVRVSGPQSLEIAGHVFTPKRPCRKFESHRLYLGTLLDPSSGEAVDEVLLSVMKAPHSYTCEDVVEINSHSGYFLLTRVLELLLNQGARLANPGEFTLRAYLNGRIDLTQAEAVVDLVNAQSERGLDLTTRQIQGSLRQDIDEVRHSGVDILALSEVAIDFPDEQEGIASREALARRIEEELLRPVQGLLEAHAARRIWVDGVDTAIVGKVNAGKSSLLNRLLNEQRAIVTPTPGTTRDIIESTVTVKGLPLRLIDTAGLGKARDEIEQMGIQLTEQKMSQADLLLVLIDQSQPLSPEDTYILDRAKGKDALVVLNKIDLPSSLDPRKDLNSLSAFQTVQVSALTGEGLDRLHDAIADTVLGSRIESTESRTIPNLRHREALKNAARFFEHATHQARGDAPMEIVALELQSGLNALGEITGTTSNEEVLGCIFSRFCLGK